MRKTIVQVYPRAGDAGENRNISWRHGERCAARPQRARTGQQGGCHVHGIPEEQSAPLRPPPYSSPFKGEERVCCTLGISTDAMHMQFPPPSP